MKTLTLVCNFVLLGIIGLSILSEGLPDEKGSVLPLMLALVVTSTNILIIAGSSLQHGWFALKPGRISPDIGIKHRWSAYNSMKIIAISLNIIFIVLLYRAYQNGLIRGSGSMFVFVVGFIVSTPLLSILRIAAGRWSRFEGLRRTALLTGASLAVLVFGSFITMRILIGQGIQENISIAQKEYPGKAEDALLAYLADSTRSPYDRTHIAIWTLGQIRSEKALPVLKRLYKDDPEGKICRGNHNTELCQYEIHKAIVSIEHKWLGAKEKNWFGSWTRLNE